MWWGGPMKGRRPNAASYMQWAPGAGTSLAGLRASLWLSKLGLLIVSRQVNFNYLKVYLAHGKIPASLTPQTLKVQAISTVPFLHSTDTGAAPAGGGQALVYLSPKPWHTHVKLRSSPEAPQFRWRKGVCHSIYYSVLMWDPLHELCILFIWPRGRRWVKCSNICLRKSFLQDLHEWYCTSVLNADSYCSRIWGLWINTSRGPILTSCYVLLPS